MAVETEKRTMVLVFGVALFASLAISGSLVYWMTGDGYKTPGFKEIVSRPTGLNAALKTDLQPPDRWPNLFGPNHDSVANSKGVQLPWPGAGPKELWRKPLGIGYSSVVVDRGRLIAFGRQGDEEIVEALDAKSGASQWRFAYPTHYVDRYGYNGGPRCTPIIDGDKIYTYGAEGMLHAIGFQDGKKLWARNLIADYKVEQAFFGVGPTPLLEGGRLIVNVGGKADNAGIVSIEAATGKTVWQATSDGPSYATPRAETIHGLRHVFVFTEAGLVDLEPSEGKVRWSIPFRSAMFESVNATSPLVVGEIVLISATYNTGSLCLRIKPDGGYEELWRDRRSLESHFSNMIHADGFVYAFSGRHSSNCSLVCVELTTGKVKWSNDSDLGRGSMVRVGSRLILWGETGRLGLLTIDSNKANMESVTPQRLLGGHCWTPPTLCDGRMYLRGETELACYDLKNP